MSMKKFAKLMLTSLFFLNVVISLGYAESYYDMLSADKWQKYATPEYWLIPGRTGEKYEDYYHKNCKVFVQLVMQQVFGKTVAATNYGSDMRKFTSGTYVGEYRNEVSGNPSAATIKSIFENAKVQVGDVVQMVWHTTEHTFIIRKRNDSGIEVLEANNPGANIRNYSYSWGDLETAYRDAYSDYVDKKFSRRDKGGFTIYRYISEISDGGGTSGNNDNPTPAPEPTPAKIINITTNSSLPDGTYDTDYEKTFDCTGDGSTRWQKIAGSFPAGIELDEGNGRIWGHLREKGYFTFTLQAENDSGTGKKEFTFYVKEPDEEEKEPDPAPEPIEIKNTPPAGKVGDEYNFTFETSEGNNGHWELLSGSFPPDLNFDFNNGHFSGKLTKEGVFTFKLKVTKNSKVGEKEITFIVNPSDEKKIEITTDSTLPSDKINNHYDFTFQATGNGNPHWEKISGSFPADLNLDENSGHLSGKLTQTGTFSFRLKVTRDSAVAEKDFTFVVQDTGHIEITTDSLIPSDKEGNDYDFTFQATGDGSPHWEKLSGSFPSDLNFDQGTGRLYGKINQHGTFSFRLKVTRDGKAAEKDFTFYVAEKGGIEITIDSRLPNVLYDCDYDLFLQATGDGSPHWEKLNGDFPSGLNFDYNNGHFWGKTTQEGTFNFRLKVTKNSKIAEKDFIMVVRRGDSLAVNTNSLKDGEVGSTYKQRIDYSINYGSSITGYKVHDSLPDGLSVTISNGQVHIEGTPNKAGIFSFSFELRNSEGSVSKNFTLKINGDTSYETTQWEIVNDALVVAYVGNYKKTAITKTFSQQASKTDKYFIVSGLPANTKINLPDEWLLDTTQKSVNVADSSKVTVLGAEAVRIEGNNTITTKTDNVSFTARQIIFEDNSYEVTRWETVDNALFVAYKGDVTGNEYTLRFLKQSLNTDNFFLVEKLPANTRISLRGNWVLDAATGSVSFENASNVKAIGLDSIRIFAENTVTTEHDDVQFTARLNTAEPSGDDDDDTSHSYETIRWESVNHVLKIEYKNTATENVSFIEIERQDINGDKCYIIENKIPANTKIHLPKGWTLDTDRNAVTVESNAQTEFFDTDSIKIYGKTTITTNYDSLKFTTRQDIMPEFMSHALVLSGQIGAFFYADLPEISGVDYLKSYMTFDINGDTVSNNPQEFDPQVMNATGKYYGFVCYVTSVQMADPITASLHYGDGKIVEHNYSVKEYLDTIIEKTASDSMRELAKAMKDYGHYMQIYLARKNGWEIGIKHEAMDYANVYTNDDIEEIRRLVSDYAIVRDTGNSGIEKVTFALELNSETIIDVYLKVKDGYKGNVSAYLDDSRENVAVLQPDGRYLVQIAGVSAHLLGNTYTIHVNAGGEFDVKISALSYVNSILNASGSVQDIKEAVASLYDYYDATMAYRKAKGQ